MAANPHEDEIIDIDPASEYENVIGDNDDWIYLHTWRTNSGPITENWSSRNKADYKEDAIKELKDDMKELKKSMDSLDKTINDYIIKSIEDDNTLKSYINSLENRITALEAADSERWKFYLGLGTAATVISLIINHFILK